MIAFNAVTEKLKRSHKKRAIKNATKGKLEGLLGSFMTIFSKKVQFMNEEDTTNQKIQSRRAINLLESFRLYLVI